MSLYGTSFIRKRPGMFLEPLQGGAGLAGLAEIAAGNAVNEVLAGHADNVWVTLDADNSCTVADDGRGLPTAIEERFGVSAAEFIMTAVLPLEHRRLPEQCARDDLCVVTALSTALELVIWREGVEHQMRFADGKPQTSLTIAGSAPNKHGTKIRFWPDPSFFGTSQFDHAELETRLRKLGAQFNVAIHFTDAR